MKNQGLSSKVKEMMEMIRKFDIISHLKLSKSLLPEHQEEIRGKFKEFLFLKMMNNLNDHLKDFDEKELEEVVKGKSQDEAAIVLLEFFAQRKPEVVKSIYNSFTEAVKEFEGIFK